MSGVRREPVEAQAAAERLIAAACRGMGSEWSRNEALHAAASSKVEAAAAAAPLLRVCESCPITMECRMWARIDGYTGVAAGSAWLEGSARPVSWVPSHPPRRLAG